MGLALGLAPIMAAYTPWVNKLMLTSFFCEPEPLHLDRALAEREGLSLRLDSVPLIRRLKPVLLHIVDDIRVNSNYISEV